MKVKVRAHAALVLITLLSFAITLPAFANASMNSSQPLDLICCLPTETAEQFKDTNNQLTDSTIICEHFRWGETSGVSWTPVGECDAVLLCAHGVSMCADSYEQFGKRLAKMNIATYAVDIKGFGSSAGQPGRWIKPDPDNECSALKLVLDKLHTRYPTKPVFFLGESIGGCFGIRLAALYPGAVTGIICSSPAWRLYKYKRMIMKKMLDLIMGRGSSGLATSGIIRQATRDPEIVARWKTNPKYRFQFSLPELLNGLRFIGQTGSYPKKMAPTPLLMAHGLKDRLVKPIGTAVLFRRAASVNKELLLIENSEHLIFEEVQPGDEVTHIVVDWMKRQTKPQSKLTTNSISGNYVGTSLSKKERRLFKVAGINLNMSRLSCRNND